MAELTKYCSSIHKYLDKKSFDKCIKIFKDIDTSSSLKDLSEKDRKKVEEVCARAKRKSDNDEVKSLVESILSKLPKKPKDKTSKREKAERSSVAAEKSSKSQTKKVESSEKSQKSEKDLDWEATAPLPERKKNGILVFPDFPDFQPNLTPKEVLQAGSFGGTYYRPIYSSVTKQKYGPEVWKELPEDWIKGLNVKTQVASPIYDEKVNKYKVKCGGSLQMWEESGWIQPQDPYGWFQWYCRFYQGRRTDDDARQVSRWWNCASVNGRWKNNLISKIFKAGAKFDNPKISPVVRQTLLHWGYDLTEEDFQKRAKKLTK